MRNSQFGFVRLLKVTYFRPFVIRKLIKQEILEKNKHQFLDMK